MDLIPVIDGNWVDMGSLAVALPVAAWKYRRKHPGLSFLSREFAIEYGNCSAVLPLILLFLGVFSSEMLIALMSANKMILATAAFFTIVSALND